MDKVSRSLDMINIIPTNNVWDGLERSHSVGRAGVCRLALVSLPLFCPMIILQVSVVIYFDNFCYVVRITFNPSINATLAV